MRLIFEGFKSKKCEADTFIKSLILIIFVKKLLCELFKLSLLNMQGCHGNIAVYLIILLKFHN